VEVIYQVVHVRISSWVRCVVWSSVRQILSFGQVSAPIVGRYCAARGSRAGETSIVFDPAVIVRRADGLAAPDGSRVC
jgi:hypothetical protein